MNKFIYATILVSIWATVVVVGGPIQKSINGVDKQLSRLGNKIEVRIENIAQPPVHQSGNHGLLSSAFRGVGRLLRNVTGNAGKFAKSTAGAVGQSISEVKNRMLNPKPIQPPPMVQPETVIETVIPESAEELQNDANDTLENPEQEEQEATTEASNVTTEGAIAEAEADAQAVTEETIAEASNDTTEEAPAEAAAATAAKSD